MRKRSKSRSYAIQMLYQAEIRPEFNNEDMNSFWERAKEEDLNKGNIDQIRYFADQLFKEVKKNLQKIDEMIRSSAEHWDLERMAIVDRNILRLGIAEILFFEDIPAKVAINEAIELAKTFGDCESPRFVNGILDKVARSHKNNNEPA